MKLTNRPCPSVPLLPLSPGADGTLFPRQISNLNLQAAKTAITNCFKKKQALSDAQKPMFSLDLPTIHRLNTHQQERRHFGRTEVASAETCAERFGGVLKCRISAARQDSRCSRLLQNRSVDKGNAGSAARFLFVFSLLFFLPGLAYGDQDAPANHTAAKPDAAQHPLDTDASSDGLNPRRLVAAPAACPAPRTAPLPLFRRGPEGQHELTNAGTKPGARKPSRESQEHESKKARKSWKRA